MSTLFVIRETVTTGDKWFATIETVTRYEHGFFRDRKEAEKRAEELGETFYADEAIGA